MCVKTKGFLPDTEIMLETFKWRQLSNSSSKGEKSEEKKFSDLRQNLQPAENWYRKVSVLQIKALLGLESFCLEPKWGSPSNRT